MVNQRLTEMNFIESFIVVCHYLYKFNLQCNGFSTTEIKNELIMGRILSIRDSYPYIRAVPVNDDKAFRSVANLDKTFSNDSACLVVYKLTLAPILVHFYEVTKF